MPFAGKPILGIVGGIASGKSYVSKTLASLGCCVIDSDAVAHGIYRQPGVIQTLRDWYGPEVIDATGQIDRRKIGAIVFRDPSQRRRLEALLHPLIHSDRNATMQQHAADPSVRAFVWDSPLLIEASLHLECDAILFVDTPYDIRLERVRQTRGWDAAELERRERSQISLDTKRNLSTEIVDGTLEPETLRAQLDAMLLRLQLSVSSGPSRH